MFWHVSGILWKIRNYGATIEEEPSLRRTLRELKTNSKHSAFQLGAGSADWWAAHTDARELHPTQAI